MRWMPLLVLSGCWLGTDELRAVLGAVDRSPPSEDDTDTDTAPPPSDTALDSGWDSAWDSGGDSGGAPVCVPALDLGAAREGTWALGDEPWSDQVEVSCGDEPGEEVLVSWTAPEAACMVLSTRGSGVDTRLSVWEAGCTRERACNETAAPGRTDAEVHLPTPAGRTWQIAVQVPSGRPRSDVELTLDEGRPVPVDDDLGDRIEDYNNLDATPSVDGVSDPDGHCRRLVEAAHTYAWRAPATGRYRFEVEADDDVQLSALRPCRPEVLACADGLLTDTERLTLDLTAGETIVLRVALSTLFPDDDPRVDLTVTAL